jgi:hypothetical protein
MTEQQKPNDPLPGEHAANDHSTVNWQANKQGQGTLKLKHPSNRRRTK